MFCHSLADFKLWRRPSSLSEAQLICTEVHQQLIINSWFTSFCRVQRGSSMNSIDSCLVLWAGVEQLRSPEQSIPTTHIDSEGSRGFLCYRTVEAPSSCYPLHTYLPPWGHPEGYHCHWERHWGSHWCHQLCHASPDRLSSQPPKRTK